MVIIQYHMHYCGAGMLHKLNLAWSTHCHNIQSYGWAHATKCSGYDWYANYYQSAPWIILNFSWDRKPSYFVWSNRCADLPRNAAWTDKITTVVLIGYLKVCHQTAYVYSPTSLEDAMVTCKHHAVMFQIPYYCNHSHYNIIIIRAGGLALCCTWLLYFGIVCTFRSARSVVLGAGIQLSSY